jgi:pseudaminic acid cytidylyltransferase
MTIAIIPARGGSRRIPRKNLLPMPTPYGTVLGHAIMMCRAAGITEVYVSTDDREIGRVATTAGAYVLERSYEMAQDEVGTQEVIGEAVRALGSSLSPTETTVCVYPCTPLLMADDLRKAVVTFRHTAVDGHYIVSVGKYTSPIHHAMEFTGTRLRYAMPQFRKWTSDRLPERYYDAGQFYIGQARSFAENVPLDTNMVPYVLPPWLAVDINTQEDWDFAMRLYPSDLNRFFHWRHK